MDTKLKKKGSKHARLSMARLAAVQCVYQWLQARASAKDILTYYHDHFTGFQVEEEELLPPDQALLSDILQGVQTRFTDLKDIINQHMTKKDEAIDVKKDLLVLSILYCGGYELMAHLDIDPPLIISDYIHVTRSFYEGAESKLVNGILDSLKTTLDR